MAVVETAATPRTTLSERLVGWISRTPVHIALVVLALIWLVPSVGLLVTSFRKRPDIAASGWWEAIGDLDFTIKNYSSVLDAQNMADAFLNSLFIAVPSTILPLMIGALAAFAFSWIAFPFRDTVFLAIVALMVVPIQAALIPVLKLFRELDITDSFIGIWLAHTGFALPFAIFLLRNFFITLPRDLIEAARVDGASNLHIFARVVLPLSVPALASFAIFQFLWVWNDLLNALIFVQNPDQRPLTVTIVNLQSAYGAEWHLLSAGSFILMLLPLLVFFSLQRFFVQGLLSGSVK
ncbi:MAG: carbohydrate ABC transporter permease [Actinobacteria bacterium]|nr:carbohydrate ABC transporter permease [Actinomycetota bacterium]